MEITARLHSSGATGRIVDAKKNRRDEWSSERAMRAGWRQLFHYSIDRSTALHTAVQWETVEVGDW